MEYSYEVREPYVLELEGIRFGIMTCIFTRVLQKQQNNEESVTLTYEHNVKCNVFYADNLQEARRYLKMSIDTVLTNDSLNVYNANKDIL